MWKNHEQEQSPLKKVKILEKIASLQPYLSAYYEASKMVIQESRGIAMNNSSFGVVMMSRESFLHLMIILIVEAGNNTRLLLL